MRVFQRSLYYLCFFLLQIGFLYFANFKTAKLPPVAKILNPFTGLWQGSHHWPEESQGKVHFIISDKSSDIQAEVFFDDYKLPHIRAKDEVSLYFAQGYVHAHLRLFQMELTKRLGAGRLSEWLGRKTIELDRFHVHMGLRTAAQRTAKLMAEDSEMNLAIQAYARGVNLYIDQLSENDYPPEYKLLDAKPEHFQAVDVAYLLKSMTVRLAGKSFDLEMSRVAKKWGRAKIEEIFYPYMSEKQQIISESKHHTSPHKPTSADESFETVFNEVSATNQMYAFPPGKGEDFDGSNNWAVYKSKTKEGFNLVSNDTHLSFTLPNPYLEMQLTDTKHNVYGASFPGAPGIIIGFNSLVSWATTNATVDVMDFFEIQTRNNDKEYFFDGQWRPLEKVTEEIKIRGEKSELINLLWNHRGVVVDEKPDKALIIAWTGLEASSTLKAILHLNVAKNYQECFDSLQYWDSPAQNIICADENDIGIRTQGKIPVKRLFQGQFVQDGSKKENDWNEYIPYADLPQEHNPKKAYVFSANQHPTDNSYPYFLGWYFAEPYRSKRIQQQLQSQVFDVDKMKALQNDIFDEFAFEMKAQLLKNIEHKELSAEQLMALEKINNWNSETRADSIETSIFYFWWKNLRKLIWQDDFWWGEKMFSPYRDFTLKIMTSNDPVDLKWFDDARTTPVETRAEIVTKAFVLAWQELSEKAGRDIFKWQWGKVIPTHVQHIARIPGFGSAEYSMGGSYSSPKVNSGEHGATWKMVVEMTKPARAWANTNGGVSGNPFDSTYESFLPEWLKNDLHSVRFLQDEDFNKQKASWVFGNGGEK